MAKRQCIGNPCGDVRSNRDFARPPYQRARRNPLDHGRNCRNAVPVGFAQREKCLHTTTVFPHGDTSARSDGDERRAKPVQLLDGVERLPQQRRQIPENHSDDAPFPFDVEADLLIEPAFEPRGIGKSAFYRVVAGTFRDSREAMQVFHQHQPVSLLFVEPDRHERGEIAVVAIVAREHLGRRQRRPLLCPLGRRPSRCYLRRCRANGCGRTARVPRSLCRCTDFLRCRRGVRAPVFQCPQHRRQIGNQQNAGQRFSDAPRHFASRP